MKTTQTIDEMTETVTDFLKKNMTSKFSIDSWRSMCEMAFRLVVDTDFGSSRCEEQLNRIFGPYREVVSMSSRDYTKLRDQLYNSIPEILRSIKEESFF